MKMTKETATKKLSLLFMEDMPIIEHKVILTKLSSDWFDKYKKIRNDFLKKIINSLDELFWLNLSEKSIIDLLTKEKIPNNISLRFRVPIIYGGEISIKNMFLCKTFPHSYNIDKFLSEQIGEEKIWLPNPEKDIYIPIHTSGTSGGGNGANLTQTANSIPNYEM